MLDLKQRNVIRGHLDKGMSPEAIANYLARVADLEEPDMVVIGRPPTTSSTRPSRPPRRHQPARRYGCSPRTHSI